MHGPRNIKKPELEKSPNSRKLMPPSPMSKLKFPHSIKESPLLKMKEKNN
jgi:hypothetical protein